MRFDVQANDPFRASDASEALQSVYIEVNSRCANVLQKRVARAVGREFDICIKRG